MTSTPKVVDVLIIGGGPAGLAAALALSRPKRLVALFDSGVYRNAKSTKMNNVPRFEETNPADHREGARAELLRRYSEAFQYIPRKVIAVRREDATQPEPGKRPRFVLTDSSNESWVGRKLILATGIEDILPTVPGFTDLWGEIVVHCVFCHGYETAGKPIGIYLDSSLGKGPIMAGLMSFLQKFKNLKNDPIVILANGIFGEDATEPKPIAELGISEQIIDVTKARGITWDFRKVKHISKETIGGTPHGVFHFSTGPSITLPYVVFTPFTKIPQSTLDLLSDPSFAPIQASLNTPNEMTKTVMGEIPAKGFFQKSELDGVFIAGNAGLFMATVTMVTGQGMNAGAGADHEIGMEDWEDEVKAASAK